MEYQKVSLNGIWKLQPGKELPQVWEYDVEVPALVDVATPNLKWQDFKYFWYRKDFEVPKDALHGRVYLQLEQVQFGTEVWLNGHHIGGDIPCYTSQEFDLTPYLNPGGTNRLLVRVGTKDTLPSHSAVGNDFEKLSFIPGIWGDVWLHYYGRGRAKWTRIISDINGDSIRVHSEIENLCEERKAFKISYRVLEKSSAKEVARLNLAPVTVDAESIEEVDANIVIPDFHLWSPESPFLYQLEIKVKENEHTVHREDIPFGMRVFEIRDGDFYLNGERRVLLGSNIAFHRLLSDSTRGTLPWNRDWIKKVLVDIPHEHNMFFFRFHLGHAYNRWYDMADEHGIMVQDEWMSWPVTGSAEQIEKEFSAWLRENCNHPSIVIWDPLNESTDSTVTEEIVPRLKRWDPTRPWEYVDFGEDHPYIYSLGPVLNGQKFGYSRSIFDMQKSTTPTMVNEYLWWWLDREGEPTSLTKIVYERWLGRNPGKEQMRQHQAYLAAELTELWRRLNLDAILPFVYLSVGEGPTANWFFGPLEELRPKPVLAALKNAFSPIGVSLELWDRHFLTEEKRTLDVYLFNDTLSDQEVLLGLSFVSQDKNTFHKEKVHLKKGEHRVVATNWVFPDQPGEYKLRAEILDLQDELIASSEKLAFVFEPFVMPSGDKIPAVALHDPSGELAKYFDKHKIPFQSFDSNLQETRVVLLNGAALRGLNQAQLRKLTQFVSRGGILVVQEPEFGVQDEQMLKVVEDLELHVQYRQDPERGGYDSYVFPENPQHFLWHGILPEHLRMFNGALGGEMVSQYHVRPSAPFETVASCNLALKVPAVMEIPYGTGWVFISRIQIRGRMLPEDSSSELYGRRYDPVAERYFWNLLTGYLKQQAYHKKIKQKLARQKFYIARVRASSGQIYDALDGKMTTRWSSKAEDPQWVWIDFGRRTRLNKLIIHWEVAYGKEYEIFKSDDNKTWELVYREPESDGDRDEIIFKELETRYLRMDFLQRGTQWGYSIWEMEFIE